MFIGILPDFNGEMSEVQTRCILVVSKSVALILRTLCNSHYSKKFRHGSAFMSFSCLLWWHVIHISSCIN